MITDPKVRRRRLQKLIDKSGGGTLATNRLASLSNTAREVILSSVRLRPGEEDLLACFLDEAHWCLLTTERLAWRTGTETASLVWPEVRDADVEPEVWDAVSRGERRKDTLEELVVTDISGDQHLLCLERGQGFFLVWSALVALRAEAPEASAAGSTA